MKGIYLTEEGKQEIENKIAELEEYKDSNICKDPRDWSFVSGKQAMLKEILASAIVLPIEESWEKLEENLLEGLHEHTRLERVIPIDYPNGVIIQPKQ
jgi:hypothetical protein